MLRSGNCAFDCTVDSGDQTRQTCTHAAHKRDDSGVQLVHDRRDSADDKMFAAVKVIVERTLGKPGLARDGVDGRGIEAAQCRDGHDTVL